MKRFISLLLCVVVLASLTSVFTVSAYADDNDNIQLFGYDIRLFRKDEQSPYNFQFILDRLASNDSTQRPLDLAISDIIIRRGTLSHDILSHPVQKRFNPDHLLLRSLSLR